MKPISKIPITPVVQKASSIAKNRQVYVQTRDVFERSDIVKDTAKTFKERVVKPFIDWNGSFPKDDQGGSKLLKAMLQPYVSFFNDMTPADSQKFTKLVFGQDQLKAIEQGSIVNSDIRQFKNALEKSMRQTIEKTLK